MPARSGAAEVEGAVDAAAADDDRPSGARAIGPGSRRPSASSRRRSRSRPRLNRPAGTRCASGPNSTNSGTAMSARAVDGQVGDRRLGDLREQDRDAIAGPQAVRGEHVRQPVRRVPELGEAHPPDASRLVLDDQCRSRPGRAAAWRSTVSDGDVVPGRDLPSEIASELLPGGHRSDRPRANEMALFTVILTLPGAVPTDVESRAGIGVWRSVTGG